MISCQFAGHVLDTPTAFTDRSGVDGLRIRVRVRLSDQNSWTLTVFYYGPQAEAQRRRLVDGVVIFVIGRLYIGGSSVSSADPHRWCVRADEVLILPGAASRRKELKDGQGV